MDMTTNPRVAFVLGGGGYLGGYQTGMLQALLERGISPDLVIGTSAGAIQGAILAANPTVGVVEDLTRFWTDCVTTGVMKVRARGLLSNILGARPALASQDALRTLLTTFLGGHTRIEDLAVPYQACAASIERATARYFDSGPLIPALLASSAIPGLWPPVLINGEHYMDGGIAETIPVSRAAAYRPARIYVLRLRQHQAPLAVPRLPWQLATVVYEVAWRHKVGQVIHARPAGIEVHLIPTGEELLEPPDNGLHTSTAEQVATIHRRIQQGHRSACQYLDGEDRTSATLRSKPRRSASTRTVQVDQPMTPFVSAKLNRQFDALDRDRDNRVTSQDCAAVATHIAATFGHAPDSPTADRLRARYADYWTAIHAAADVSDGHGLGRAEFSAALHRLANDPVSYDLYLYPVVSALLAATDTNSDQLLDQTEVHRLVTALGVPPDQALTVALRLDTNNDGVISTDELDEAYHDYFTSDDPQCPGNTLFGAV